MYKYGINSQDKLINKLSRFFCKKGGYKVKKCNYIILFSDSP